MKQVKVCERDGSVSGNAIWTVISTDGQYYMVVENQPPVNFYWSGSKKVIMRLVTSKNILKFLSDAIEAAKQQG